MDLPENIQDHSELLGNFKGVHTEDFNTPYWANNSEDGRFFINKKGVRQKRKKGHSDSRYHKRAKVYEKKTTTKWMRSRTKDPGIVVPTSRMDNSNIPLSERQQIALLMKQTDGEMEAEKNSSVKNSRMLHCTKLLEAKKRRDIAILCTEDQQGAAEELSRQLTTEETNTNVTVCEDRIQFTEGGSEFHEYSSFYVLVGSAMTSIMMSKGRLYDSVYNFFQAVEQQGKDVFVVSKLKSNEDDDLVFEFFYQLPKKCRKWYKEIDIKRLSREEFKQVIDVDEATRTDDSIPRHEQSPQDCLTDMDDNIASDTTDEEDELQNIQIGSNMKTIIHTDSNRQLIFAKQEGQRNNMQINIVSKNKKSHVKLVMKSKPTNEEFEEELFSEVKDEVLQINMETTGASNFVVKKGSVIIEMDVESGQSMDFNWICNLLNAIFKDKLAKALPEGTSLEVEVVRNIVISTNEFELMRNEILHNACVPKEKFDELQKQYEDMKQILDETLKNENLHSSCVPMDKHEALLRDYEAQKRELEALRTSAVENQSAQTMSKANTAEWKIEGPTKMEFASVTSSLQWGMIHPMTDPVFPTSKITDTVQDTVPALYNPMDKMDLPKAGIQHDHKPKVQEPDTLKLNTSDLFSSVADWRIQKRKFPQHTMELRERRKEQNRRAAQRCRAKKRVYSDVTQAALEDEKTKQAALNEEIDRLKHQNELRMRYLNKVEEARKGKNSSEEIHSYVEPYAAKPYEHLMDQMLPKIYSSLEEVQTAPE